MNRIKIFMLAWLAATLPVSFVACSDDDEPNGVTNTTGAFDVDFNLPASVVMPRNGSYTFTVNNEKSPLTSDFFYLQNGSGVSYECTIEAATPQNFTIKVPSNLTNGSYRVYMRRGDHRKDFGQTSIQIVDHIVEPAEGSTIYGLISTPDGKGVANIPVSDGFDIVLTDSEGIYQLKSKKELGYVFYTLPSNYEASANGILPRIYETTKLGENDAERIDFQVNPVNGQEKYKILFLGDMHLADRTGDLAQFAEFTADINKYKATHSSEKIYAITLGDMTWDIYWYSRKYGLDEYVKTMNDQVKNLQVFHTIGNHDNDYKATSNFEAKAKYRSTISPNYYSFNIGGVHYVVLDDIDCSKYDGTESRNYSKIVPQEQLEWLSRDLAFVDKSTPLIIMMHAQVFKPNANGTPRIDQDANNAQRMFRILSGRRVHFVTGHTHVSYTFNPSDLASLIGGENYYEHNTAAVCSSWWWSGHLTPGCHISLDGAPGGYAIWDINGSNIEWVYKATNADETYQLRSYDLNNVSFSLNDVPNMPSNLSASAKAKYLQYCNAYPANKNNEVLLNIWNWNSKWTITVTTETGRNLAVERVTTFDPLHIAALSVKRFNSASITSAPNFITETLHHFFKVKAPDADTDLNITVKDEFGNTWTEKMERPKAFSTDAYLLK
ncbi:MAG: calcineurin-like phosphoesterase family protein [Firmicutes bacterium]|nr:calcineurin-like phosphoesterase family protein [Bacillota bacterium]MCM1401905.1 calcineurin-like phosphoesterase family protein [Bacteroides sp.]MCM1477963.1 calcineurin-like phosphoesterase family protein [Bacteroides sp.]